MESIDQVQMFSESFREKLVYETSYFDQKTNSWKKRYDLTFIGIKQLILEMSKKGESMEVLKSNVERKSIDANPMNDVWYAEVWLRNKKTGHEMPGYSEAFVYPWENAPVLDDKGHKQYENVDGKRVLKTVYKQRYDQFGRTAAVSKAIRNAERPQIPEMMIQLFVEAALKNPEAVQKIAGSESSRPEDDPSIASNFCKDEKHKKEWDDKANKCSKCGKMVRMP